MILMIWVFDGLRTVNKDKDIGSLMVGCMKLATLINVITSLLETGMAIMLDILPVAGLLLGVMSLQILLSREW